MSKRTFVSAIFVAVSSLFLAACDTDYSSFKATTLSRSGSFELDLKPDDAFPLFTAPGEKLWISIWEPFILHGDGYEQGTVWITENHGYRTYWYVAAYDTKTRKARYIRVTPDADTGTVYVSVADNGNGGSKVNVTYQLTGLSKKGNEQVEKFMNATQYAIMMEDWRSMINQNRDKISDHLGG